MLVGRITEVAAIDAALDAASEGRGSLVALVGEPGIGKTHLADEACVRARSRGFRTAWGRTWEGAGAPAGWPWTQLIRELVDEGIALSAADRVELAPLLPELAASERPTADFATLDVLLRLLRRAVRASPRVVVLDDLHDADRLTLLALQLVARALRDLPLVVVVTYREAEVRLRPAVAALVEPIVREGTRLLLGRLGEHDASALFRGAANAAATPAVHRITEGNPLFVLEVARLVACGRVNSSLEGLTPTDGVRFVIDQHIALMSPESRHLLAVAALLGRELAPEDLAVIGNVDANRVEQVIAEATAAGVLVPSGGAVAFSHVLLAQTLAATLPSAERARLHGAIAQRWRSRSSGDRHLSEVAHHLLAAGGNPAEAIGVAKRAATQAIHRLAFDRAADLYARALALVAKLPDGERVAIELMIGRGEALGRSGATPEALGMCNEAVQRARAIGAIELEARAALASATQFNFHAPDPAIVGALERALESVGTSREDLRARLLAALSYTNFPSPSPARSLDQANEAISIARRLGDSGVLLAVLNDASPSALAMSLRPQQVVALGTEIVALARTHDDTKALLRGESFDVIGRLAHGDRVDVDHRMRALDQAGRATMPSQERSVLHMMRAMHARLQGRFDEADACIAETLQAALPEERPLLRALHVWGVAYTRRCDRDIEEAHTLGEMLMPPGATAWVAAARGELDEARRRLRELTPVGDFAWPQMISVWADVCVLTGDRAIADLLYPLLVPASGELIMYGPAVSLGPADRLLGGLALLRGEPDVADAHYERALALCERAGALPFYALTRAEYGRSVPAAPAPHNELSVREDRGEWIVSRGGVEVRLKDSKGLHYLERLVQTPGREVHVLELVASGEVGDAGPVIDATARRGYENRLEDLEEELREAEAFDDRERANRAQREIDALADELARAVGLGGRERRAGSLVERARINVQRRLRDVIARVDKTAPALARYLDATVKTGTYCAYAPVS